MTDLLRKLKAMMTLRLLLPDW